MSRSRRPPSREPRRASPHRLSGQRPYESSALRVSDQPTLLYYAGWQAEICRKSVAAPIFSARPRAGGRQTLSDRPATRNCLNLLRLWKVKKLARLPLRRNAGGINSRSRQNITGRRPALFRPGDRAAGGFSVEYSRRVDRVVRSEMLTGKRIGRAEVCRLRKSVRQR